VQHLTLLSPCFSTLDRPAAKKKQNNKKPNVILTYLEDGIEVVHLYTGRTLTRLPLRPQKLSLDLNGDGLLDQVEVRSHLRVSRGRA
jgi:hypothetical protein